MGTAHAYSIIFNLVLAVFFAYEYSRYCGLKSKLGRKHAIFKKLKQDQAYVMQSQSVWQKHGLVSPKAAYAWFYEHGVTFRLIGQSENEAYVNYNVSLRHRQQEYLLEVLKDLPFGIFLVYKIYDEGDSCLVEGSITFSKHVPKQQTICEKQDIEIVLDAIIKNESAWQICLNNQWITVNQTNPWNIEIIDVQHDHIKIEWKTFGKTKQYTIKLNQLVELKHEYDL